MAPERHALLSASSAHRWSVCTPSARLTEHLPGGTSKYAAEGTEAHHVCEELLRHQLAAWEAGHEPEPLSMMASTEMIQCAAKYADFIHDLWVGFDERPTVLVEQEVDFSRWVPEGFGTADCILVGAGTLHVVDYKHGMGVPVSPEWNVQMMLYALGAYALMEDIEPIDTVRMSIVQPRIQEEPETFEIGLVDLLDWAIFVLAPAAELAWEGKGELNPGEKQCRFCKAYPACRAWQDKYGPLADFIPAYDNDDANAMLSSEEIGEWLVKLDGIVQYAKDLQGYALQQLMDGAEIPGWKAVEGRGARALTDTDAAYAAIEAAGYDRAMLYETTPVSMTAAEKLVGKKMFAELVKDYIVKKPGSPKLVKDSDPRPSVSTLSGFEEASSG